MEYSSLSENAYLIHSHDIGDIKHIIESFLTFFNAMTTSLIIKLTKFPVTYSSNKNKTIYQMSGECECNHNDETDEWEDKHSKKPYLRGNKNK